MYASIARASSSHRRGGVAVLVLILIPVLLGFGALTIDVGVLFNSRADLQNAADAGALAATNVLASDRSANGVAKARQTAIEIIQRHSTLGRNLTIGSNDMVFGRIDFDAESTSFDFTPTEVFPDSVRINIQASKNSSNGPVPLYFAAIFGKRSAEVRASALAGLTGARDIAVVIDLSGSMKYDSDMRFYESRQINIRDIWASLDGPPPSDTYLPGAEGDTEYATDTGPTIGIMSTWGDPVTTTYNPTTDPGLWYIPNNAPCAIGAITASLTARGYNAARRNSIMNSSSSASWPNRVAVMIGVAEWTPSSAGDTSVSSGELTWAAYPPYRKNWTWAQLIDWVAGNNNRLTNDYSSFRFRFGLKTYVEFLLDRKYNFSETDLTGTPEEPMQSIKDGLREMVAITRSFDQMSLEVFATTARHEIDLTFDRESVADRLDAMQPNYYDSNTNIGGGLQLGIDELTSSRARENARPMIVLMSDGVSNAGPDPVSVAADAVALGIPVYTISVGAGADRAVLQEIAEMTGGQEFYAAGAASEYTVQLQGIFRTIGTMGYAALVE